jgi:hypothetical protein
MQQILMFLLLTSCSLIYDPSKIHAGDGGDAFSFADAPVDTPYVTADPSMVHATDLQPPVIYEGQGIDNSRPAVLTIRGVNFASGATVTIAPTNAGDTADLIVGTVAVAADANSLAVPITANIMTAIGAGIGVPLTITITEAGFTTTIAWTEVALDELTAVIQLPPTQQRYSRVALAAAGSLPTGGPRVTIHSMSSISLAAFHADALTTAPGAGGCSGGPPVAMGACPGDGGGGTDAAAAAGVPTPGGGAGFSAKGGDGGPGTGGPIVGDRYVASYGNPANVASGGGNGGNAYLVPGSGGSGGAGGGTLELHAEGDLTTAALTALGGAGTAGTAPGATAGGGAGGLVILRTGHTLTVASVDVTGGLGGSSLAFNQGSTGRVRVDAALGSVANAQLGPAFAIFTPVITDQHTLAVDLRLPSQIAFKLSRLDQRGVLVYLPDVMSATGTTTVDVPLINGWNKLCLTVPGGLYEDDVANECVELAFITH